LARHSLPFTAKEISMARIPYPEHSSLAPEIADRLVRLGSLNVTRMMAHAPNLMVAYSKLGTQLLRHGSVDPVLRELVILRIGVLCESEYEWYQHASVAEAVAAPADKVQAMKTGDLAPLSERERVAVRFAEQIKLNGRVGDETFAQARQLYSNAELVELVLLAGFYTMTAGHLRTFDIEPEDTPPLGVTMKANGIV
jgi:alkylhydroperoxidase family enzyme